jgi:hypothetical protein
MLQSSKDRAKPISSDFVRDFSFRPRALAALLGSRRQWRRNSMQPRSCARRDRMAIALTDVSASTHVYALKGEAAGAGRSGGFCDYD